ncbi:hypothetical protein EYC80_006999 [Monilinia laxa]|uniref:SET domain-containing protein n=1 Tax=Monilinia laxa TaxID=61186 RepID=A0A5N6K025_MONLA|nr:hypothetical protein EYC80_006999 [Monilinia laxa]
MSNWFAWLPWRSQRGRQKRRQDLIPSSSSSHALSASRADSVSRSPKRRFRQLTAAERSARAKEEKKAKEVKEQRIASMSVADRAAYKERKRLRAEERIKTLKVRFAKEKERVRVQQKENLPDINTSWKRKHDDDSAAQAAQRRQEFLATREKRGTETLYPELELVNGEREVYKIHAVELFERIYRDLQRHFLHPTLINSETYDPYRETFSEPGQLRFQRFKKLSSNPEDGTGGIGVDSAAILMLSETFRTALKYGEDPNGFQSQFDDKDFLASYKWEEFEIMLRLEHTSIRAFAIARHIPYMMIYRRTGQAIIGGNAHVADESLQLSPSTRDPFEVYLASDGRLLPCLYTPLATQVDSGEWKADAIPFQTLKENIYNKANFKNYAPPSSWPPNWEYPPVDIQHPCREWGKNYPLCVACGHRTGPPGAPDQQGGPENLKGNKICQCKTSSIFDKILVEIRQYQSSTTSKQHDRGIRSLQNLHGGHIIGEILGEFVPLGAEADFNCPTTSAIDFNGPTAVDKDGKVLQIDPDIITKRRIDTNTYPIATLITGHKGGWTRLINAGTRQTANVEARSEVWAGRLRITVRTLRHINFGEQLLIEYGDLYLEPDGQSLNAKKKDRTERLPMKSLTGFFK